MSTHTSVVFTLNMEAEEELIDAGIEFKDAGSVLLAEVKLEEDDDVLLDSLTAEDLAEFFGISSEFLIGLDVFENVPEDGIIESK